MPSICQMQQGSPRCTWPRVQKEATRPRAFLDMGPAKGRGPLSAVGFRVVAVECGDLRTDSVMQLLVLRMVLSKKSFTGGLGKR